jgi:hypothetical protein
VALASPSGAVLAYAAACVSRTANVLSSRSISPSSSRPLPNVTNPGPHPSHRRSHLHPGLLPLIRKRSPQGRHHECSQLSLKLEDPPLNLHVPADKTA